MNFIIRLIVPLLFVTSAFSQTKKPVATAPKSGYAIQLSIKPYKNQWVYLAYYYGGIKGLADSAFLDATSKGVLKTAKPLPQGIYIMASPNRSILFEMMIGANQHFAIAADTTNIDNTLKFTGSPENDQFMGYTKFINPRGRQAEEARNSAKIDSSKENITKQQLIIDKNIAEIESYRKKVITEQPTSMLAVLFKGMQDVKYPEKLKHPKTKEDSLAQYRYGKDHYWDGFDFMDGRLVRTPIFESKLKAYLNNWVVPDADSLIYEFNWMIALGRNDQQMFRYLIGYFVDNYMYPKIMGQDRVFLHVYQRFLSEEDAQSDWLNEKQRKTIKERAYMIMMNQLGAKASPLELPDTLGKINSLYDLNAEYTVVVFWDVHCGKCREEIPKMDSIYQSTWAKQNVKIYAVMVNEESLKDWPAFIQEHAKGWTHVHQTKEMKEAEEKAGKPNFRQLYDMRSTPTLFLLDKDKNIVLKNIGLDDIANIIKQKLKK